MKKLFDLMAVVRIDPSIATKLAFDTWIRTLDRMFQNRRSNNWIGYGVFVALQPGRGDDFQNKLS
jgi:flagellar basal body P-ring protein FlgI